MGLSASLTSLASERARGAAGAFGPVGRAQAAQWTLSGCPNNHPQEFRPPSLPLGEKGRELARLAAWLLFQPLVKGEAENWIPYPQQPRRTAHKTAQPQREECAKTFFRVGNPRRYFVLGG